MSPQHRHVGVILTAGVLENVDEAQAQRVEADAVLRKPFEASALLASVRPLAQRAQEARREGPESGAVDSRATAQPEKASAVPFVAVVDAEQVRAAVTVALDASMARMVEEITRHVLVALETQETKSPAALASGEPPVEEIPMVAEAAPAEADTAESEPSPWPEPAHRVTTLRRRPGSILGLDDFPAEEEEPSPQE